MNSTSAFHGDSFFADPYATYARVRDRGEPVFEPISQAWLITRYSDVEALLRESRVSKNFRRDAPTAFDMSVLFQDPPDHTRVREILNRAFSGDAMKGLDGFVRQVADDLIDRMKAGERTDFMSAFALPLPVAVIAGLLGIPSGDAEELYRLSGAFIVEDSVPAAESRRLQYAAVSSMTEYFRQLVDRRRNHLRDDVLSALVQARDEKRLSDDELIGNCILLMVAGHETTVNLLGNGLHLLLRHPEQQARLSAQPGLWTSAIEEMLRYESPVQLGTFRVTTAPLEYSGGRVEAGCSVTAVIGSANRDPAQFPEPDRFDITRTPNRHLAFGMGPHRCLGGALARTEAKIGFSRLLERLPNLRLAADPVKGWRRMVPWDRPPVPWPHWRKNAVTRGFTELRVAW